MPDRRGARTNPAENSAENSADISTVPRHPNYVRCLVAGAGAAAAAVVLLAGCTSGAGSSGTTGSGAASGGAGSASSTGPSGGAGRGGDAKVTVFAAASLKDAFTRIATDHPELAVTFSFDGSNTLVDQLAGGARADVFASADTKNMEAAVGKGLIDGAPTTFARNVLVLIVPKGNPAKVTGLDGSLTGKKLVVCAKGVPCGNATATLATNLGVTLTPVSEETKVTDVRGKVESGEADAGLVYATDAKAAGAKVETLAVPGADKVVNDYPIALVKGAPNAGGGRDFLAAVTSAKGKAVLAQYGFRTP